MGLTLLIGTVLLTLATTRLVEYFLFDLRRESGGGTWGQRDNIPEVEMEEV